MGSMSMTGGVADTPTPPAEPCAPALEAGGGVAILVSEVGGGVATLASAAGGGVTVTP
jgi:hypothetical protein